MTGARSSGYSSFQFALNSKPIFTTYFKVMSQEGEGHASALTMLG